MKKSSIILTFVVGLFGVGSAVLGFIAEAKKPAPELSGHEPHDCFSTPSFVLGLCAVPLLLVALITFSFLIGCCGCCKACKPWGGYSSSRWRRIVGIICSVLTWISAVLAVVYFLPASWTVTGGHRTATSCHLKFRKFNRAAVLSLVASVLGVSSSIMFHAGERATAGDHKPPQEYRHAPHGRAAV